MYVCMYEFMYVCMYVCKHVYVQLCMYVYNVSRYMHVFGNQHQSVLVQNSIGLVPHSLSLSLSLCIANSYLSSSLLQGSLFPHVQIHAWFFKTLQSFSVASASTCLDPSGRKQCEKIIICVFFILHKIPSLLASREKKRWKVNKENKHYLFEGLLMKMKALTK